jgi:hypothetical protein
MINRANFECGSANTQLNGVISGVCSFLFSFE